MDFEKIIKTQYNSVIEDFFVCDCFFDIVFDFLINERRDLDISYYEFSNEVEKKFPTNCLLLSFIGCAVMICKQSLQYYLALKNEPFLKRSFIPNFISLNGERTAICVACLIKSILENDVTFFLKHFRLAEEYRSNETCLHLLLPIRTFNTTSL